ncbi:CobW family GTP-binding protein [Methylobacterium frigidaeris]|uniref:Metal chaperone YciC n=1 Tax=Methylobacterium frigidaeris TaxID=2038277 RepID=A0AA37HIS8_9HYPH|nr:CobW family GTP-binding protein [Methylobacterium frigidaeris]GJD66349.1 Putative metal chaperone YciC [Methylobacterium frigidaeris]
MTVPVLLVAGFLGAGKTTLVSHLLAHAEGRRIAAVVNDFGAVDIDAALIAQSTGTVVSLRNGCICCSLQGDLMRTLAQLIRRDPVPDAIVIETSGASDPAEIVRTLLDPVIYAATPLDTVVSVIDARHLADRPALADDALWRAQLAAADFVIVAKTDLVDAAELAGIRAEVARWKPPCSTFDAVRGAVPLDLLFHRGEPAAAPPREGRRLPAAERFDSLSWTASRPLSLARFQAAIGRLTPGLLRAKGFVTFDHAPHRPMLFQLVGARATIIASPVATRDEVCARLVLIWEAGCLDRDDALRLLGDAVAPPGEAAGVSTGRA